jgi:hypothetical protein
MIRQRVPRERVPAQVRIKNSADFFRVDYDDVVVLNGVPFFVRNNEREGRFGLDDEPKFWVKRAINLETGEIVIIKWIFREKFNVVIGNYQFECVRSPKRESRILELVQGRDDFMQGTTVADSSGSPLRILKYIRGRTLAQITLSLGKDHDDFFHHYFPALFEEYIGMVKAIRFLHEREEKHGDIRRDHLIKDDATGRYRWIDFDFNYRHGPNRYAYDLFGLGNILMFITGRGDVTTHQLLSQDPDMLGRLTDDDLNIVFHNRVANLRKVYPYIPEILNRVLMHFSKSARVFYDTTNELLDDLGEAREELNRL